MSHAIAGWSATTYAGYRGAPVADCGRLPTDSAPRLWK